MNLLDTTRIDSIAKKYPENLLFYTDKELLVGLKSRNDVKIAVGAELCIRYFLSENSDYLEILKSNNILSKKEASEFRIQMPFDRDVCSSPDDFTGRTFWIPESDSPLSSGCLASFRARMKKMSQTDGLIPVVPENDETSAFFLPFRIVPDKQGCYDLDEGRHEEWSKYLLKMGLKDCGIELLIHLKDCPLELTGSSMMLPVFMAWCRWKRLLPANGKR